jgi:hypothetical protein
MMDVVKEAVGGWLLLERDHCWYACSLVCHALSDWSASGLMVSFAPDRVLCRLGVSWVLQVLLPLLLLLLLLLLL